MITYLDFVFTNTFLIYQNLFLFYLVHFQHFFFLNFLQILIE